MKIYFAGSITGGREDVEVYQQLIGYLQNYGIVLTEHLADETLSKQGESNPTEVFERDVRWLRQADVVIAEISRASHGVGYELGKAEKLEKPVLCIYHCEKASGMLTGNPYYTIQKYKTIEEASKIIKQFLLKVRNSLETE